MKARGYFLASLGYPVRMKNYYVYILSSRPYGSLYIGVTSHLIKRVWAHKFSDIKGFTRKYRINSLVYFEMFEDIFSAIKHEKRLKQWPRSWKIQLIMNKNPAWKDLYNEIIG